jgi:hypothetical protein
MRINGVVAKKCIFAVTYMIIESGHTYEHESEGE